MGRPREAAGEGASTAARLLLGQVMDRDMIHELYLALVLLGADPLLLASVENWRNGVEQRDLLADLRNWNEAKRLELEEWLSSMTGSELAAVEQRIRQYDEGRRELRQAA